MTDHPTTRLEETIHQRVRLGIMALLQHEDRRPFGALRDALGLNEGTLSGHISVLEQAGYVDVEKGYDGRRPRTWVSLTSRGHAALAAQVATMWELMAEFERHGGRGQGSTKGAQSDRALAALFALGALFGPHGEPASKSATAPANGVGGSYGLSDMIINSDDVPTEFHRDEAWSGPINRFYETPVFEHPGFLRDDTEPARTWPVPPLSAHRATRATLRTLGFLSGYQRGWIGEMEGISFGSIQVAVHELGDSDASNRWFAEWHGEEEGGIRLSVLQRALDDGTMWRFGAAATEGRFTCELSISGKTSDVAGESSLRTMAEGVIQRQVAQFRSDEVVLEAIA